MDIAQCLEKTLCIWMEFDKDDLIDSTKKGALRILGRTQIRALILGERNLWMSFLVVENLDESDQFKLVRISSGFLM